MLWSMIKGVFSFVIAIALLHLAAGIGYLLLLFIVLSFTGVH